MQSLLNFLATRKGVGLSMAALLMLALLAATSFLKTQARLDETHAILEDGQLANGYSAMSDLFRINMILHEAAAGGELTPALAEELRRALDMAHVRADHFDIRLRRLAPRLAAIRDGDWTRSLLDAGRETVELLRKAVTLGDAAVAADAVDTFALGSQLAAVSQDARSSVQIFIREMDQVQSILLTRQNRALFVQGVGLTVIVTIFVLTCLGSLLLLRREIMSGRARRKAEERARYLAYFDPLTGLPNRVQFQDFGTRLLAESRRVALVLVDFDNFKEINDRHGHAMGDAVLREVGLRLARDAEDNLGLAARVGGDEFAIILPSDNLEFLARFCESALEAGVQPVVCGGNTARPSISIGLATATQVSANEALDIELLSRVADFALYVSKSEGKGRYTLYDADLDRRFLARRQMLEDLPAALRSGDIDVWLQPKVELATGATYGFEALARWRRDGEVVTPADFIDVAEEGGLIKDIDLVMLERSSTALDAANRRHGTAFTLSVNLSALHLLDDGDTDRIIEAIGRMPLPHDMLTLEITESVQLADWHRVDRAISRLRATGCRISIDDFGTGYSSLAYLRTISADELKIDKSLIAEIETSSESQFILDAVADLARSLDLDLVVEGVERESQIEMLRQFGCTYAQGYYFGRPAPVDEAFCIAAGLMSVPRTLPEETTEDAMRSVFAL